jgi:hypothetical protein
MKTFGMLSLVICSCLTGLAGSANADLLPPQFAVIQADKPSYTAGSTAAITVSVPIQPSNPDDEILIIPKLAGLQIDATQLSNTEWALVTPILNVVGDISFEADVYLENKFQAINLNSTIAFYEQEIAQLQIQIQNTHDAGTIAALNAQVTRDQGFIQTAQNQLPLIRRLIETDQISLTVTPGPIPTPSPSNVIQIDAGSASPYVGSDGTTWSADMDYSGGTTYASTAPVTGTSNSTLYQSGRYATTSFSYSASVRNGDYDVTLKFAETYWSAAGKRIFNVAINGTTVLSNFDIFATAGGANIANDQTFPVTVTTGQIQILFTSSVDNAVVNAIQIGQVAKANQTSSLGSDQLGIGRIDGGPAFNLDADISNRTYKVGQIATFFVTLLTDFTGTDGPDEVVARAQVDGVTVSGVQGSLKTFSFASNSFTTAQIGPGTFSASVFVRSKARSDSLRDAIDQATHRKDCFIADCVSTVDPQRRAFDHLQIQKLTTIINQFYAQLEASLTFVGTETLDFTVLTAN